MRPSRRPRGRPRVLQRGGCLRSFLGPPATRVCADRRAALAIFSLVTFGRARRGDGFIRIRTRSSRRRDRDRSPWVGVGSAARGWWPRTPRLHQCASRSDAAGVRRSTLMSARTDTASPWMTASMSVVMRCTPWAITAIPPITIHGAPVSDSASLSAASASSIRDVSGPRRTSTLLDVRPAAPHLLDRPLADDIARAGPSPHGLQRRQGGQRLRHRTRRARPLGGLQRALHLRRRPLTCQPALHCRSLVIHGGGSMEPPPDLRKPRHVRSSGGSQRTGTHAHRLRR